MKIVTLIGKIMGVYENHPYYQLAFVEPVSEDSGTGQKPYIRRVIKNGVPSSQFLIGCTPEFYGRVNVGESFESDGFLFNSKGKIADY